MILFDQAGAGERAAQIISPDPPLKAFVEHLWVQYSLVPQTCPTSWRVVPDANPHMIAVVPRGARFMENIRCAVVGARSRFKDVSMADRALTLGVRFHPGVLPLLTHCLASDLTDRSMPVEEVFGVRGKLLMDRLCSQKSVVQALCVLAEFLSSEFRHRRLHYGPCGFETGKDRAEDLASLLRLPKRTLYARMKQHVGLAPKRLLRIQRLHRAFNLCHKQPMPWAHVSAICKFADQAHLVREFKDLLGETPAAWQGRALSAELFKTNPKIGY